MGIDLKGFIGTIPPRTALYNVLLHLQSADWQLWKTCLFARIS